MTPKKITFENIVEKEWYTDSQHFLFSNNICILSKTGVILWIAVYLVSATDMSLVESKILSFIVGS